MRFLLTTVLIMSLFTNQARALDADGVRAEIRRHADATPTVLNPQQFEQAKALFATIVALHGAPAPDALAGWPALGYKVVPLNGGDARFALLPDAADAATQGIFLFDASVSRRDAIQAPHLRDDTGTGELALRAFFTGNLFAVMTSTVRREAVDLAHEPHSLFTAFAAALAAQTGTRLVQLHGFEREKRETAAGRIADTVASSGKRWPGPRALALRQCLTNQLGGLHRVFGVDIDELGGTQNASFAQFPSTHDGFLHLEMAREFRTRLRDNEADEQRFFQCLFP